MGDLKLFCNKYGGVIVGFAIGIVLAILILCTDFYKVILAIALIVMCIYFGNYIQRNKENVKEKTKQFIDKL